MRLYWREQAIGWTGINQINAAGNINETLTPARRARTKAFTSSSTDSLSASKHPLFPRSVASSVDAEQYRFTTCNSNIARERPTCILGTKHPNVSGYHAEETQQKSNEYGLFPASKSMSSDEHHGWRRVRKSETLFHEVMCLPWAESGWNRSRCFSVQKAGSRIEYSHMARPRYKQREKPGSKW